MTQQACKRTCFKGTICRKELARRCSCTEPWDKEEEEEKEKDDEEEKDEKEEEEFIQNRTRARSVFGNVST